MYIIDTDGKTIVAATCERGGGVLLEDGRHIPEEKLDYLFVGEHPRRPFKNQLLRQNDGGEWEYRQNASCNKDGWHGGVWTPTKRASVQGVSDE